MDVINKPTKIKKQKASRKLDKPWRSVDKEQIVDNEITDEELERLLWNLERMEILTGRF
jgi:hypothetical protein